jgi:hypothetical protein
MTEKVPSYGGLHLAGFNTGVVSSRRHANL